MKRALSVFLAMAMTLLMLVPAVTAFAADVAAVSVTASSDNPITIKKKTTLPEQQESDGKLNLTGGTFNIDRDYSQKCMIAVENTGAASVEYYLTVSNTYEDIYLNFVRSGSAEIPLVIAANETQQIQLDVFTQNATRANYTLPIYAHVVEDGSESVDAMTTAYLRVPTVALSVSFTKKSSDPHTLAQVFTLKNQGSAVSDLTIEADDALKDYVFFSPSYSNYPLQCGETIEFTVSPDLYKMKTTNLTKLEGSLIAKAGGSETKVAVSFDTQGQEITTTTMGEIVAYQFGLNDNQLSTKRDIDAVLPCDYKTNQCTNAGKVSLDAYAPPVGRDTLITSDNTSAEKVRLFVTSRMYGGDGVNRWYGSSDPDYVDIADTTYDYYLNGIKVAQSHNSGVTDLSIVELPTNHLRFGATNRIVRDYDTNPGHYFVTADTTVIFLFPSDTPISYIGSPDTLPDYRPLPDFAVYSENIFNKTTDIVKGEETEIRVKIYNKGAMEGTFDIEITDGDKVLYQEENHALDCFSGDEIAFTWTPTQNSHTIAVKLTNTTEGIPERDDNNNTASRTFSIRRREIPYIDSITPDYVVEGESIVYATVSKYADVTKAEFYVDDTLYTGEVNSSVYGQAKRYWINDSALREGEHTVRVVVYYINDNDAEESVELSKDVSVLPTDWDRYVFTIDDSLSNTSFYILDETQQNIRRVYNVTRSGNQCVYRMTKAEYDAPDKYSLIVVSDDALLSKRLSDDNALMKSDGNTVTFKANDETQISSVTMRSLDGKNIGTTFYNKSVLTLTPGVYVFDVYLYYMNESRTVRVTADVSAENQTIDLSGYFTQYTFSFKDAVEGTPSVMIFLPNEGKTITPRTRQTGGKLTAALSVSDESLLNAAKKAVIRVCTKDVVFTADAKTAANKETLIDKSKLQKYDFSAGEFTVTSVEISCADFAVTLYTPTVYVTPGEYEITAYCKDLGADSLTAQAYDGVRYAPQTEEEAYVIAFKVSDAFDRYASVYAAASGGDVISNDHYFSGDRIAAKKDIYNTNISLFRNTAIYSVEMTADATKSRGFAVGNTFTGSIANSFGTNEAYSKVRLYLTDLKDEYQNRLTAFSSKNETDDLTGRVVFTNTDDASDTHAVTVRCSSLSSIDVTLPDLDGTYTVSLELSNAEEFKTMAGLTLSETELVLNCNRTYALQVEIRPEDYNVPQLVWISSDENVAVVDGNGVVTTSAENEGTAIITVQTQDGSYSAQCTVTVEYSRLQRIRQIAMKILRPINRFFLKIYNAILDYLNRG